MNAIHLTKQKLLHFVLAGLVVLAIFSLTTTALATPPGGLTAQPLASGSLTEPIRMKLKARHGGVKVDTDVANIMMVQYTLVPGGTFGWHKHGGSVWVVVKSGSLSIYEDDDPTCTPQVYTAGQGFLDPGNHVHLGVNETNEPVVVYATFMLPEGGLPRLDADDPGICN